jgi:hypothetical protein
VKKIVSCAAAVGLLVAAASSVFAGGGASAASPGHEFKSSGTAPVSGRPGASGWAPGQQMINNVKPASGVTAPGNGAAVYAPGFLK